MAEAARVERRPRPTRARPRAGGGRSPALRAAARRAASPRAPQRASSAQSSSTHASCSGRARPSWTLALQARRPGSRGAGRADRGSAIRTSFPSARAPARAPTWAPRQSPSGRSCPTSRKRARAPQGVQERLGRSRARVGQTVAHSWVSGAAPAVGARRGRAHTAVRRVSEGRESAGSAAVGGRTRTSRQDRSSEQRPAPRPRVEQGTPTAGAARTPRTRPGCGGDPPAARAGSPDRVSEPHPVDPDPVRRERAVGQRLERRQRVSRAVGAPGDQVGAGPGRELPQRTAPPQRPRRLRGSRARSTSSGPSSGCADRSSAISRRRSSPALLARESVPSASGTPAARQAARSNGARSKKACVPGQCTSTAPARATAVALGRGARCRAPASAGSRARAGSSSPARPPAVQLARARRDPEQPREGATSAREPLELLCRVSAQWIADRQPSPARERRAARQQLVSDRVGRVRARALQPPRGAGAGARPSRSVARARRVVQRRAPRATRRRASGGARRTRAAAPVEVDVPDGRRPARQQPVRRRRDTARSKLRRLERRAAARASRGDPAREPAHTREPRGPRGRRARGARAR